MQNADSDVKLRESLTIVDAKSVYDSGIKEGAQAADRYMALEVAIAKDRADGLGVQLRWVEHQSMIVDLLTKFHGNPQALYSLLKSGFYKITVEDNKLTERADLRAAGKAKPR